MFTHPPATAAASTAASPAAATAGNAEVRAKNAREQPSSATASSKHRWVAGGSGAGSSAPPTSQVSTSTALAPVLRPSVPGVPAVRVPVPSPGASPGRGAPRGGRRGAGGPTSAYRFVRSPTTPATAATPEAPPVTATPTLATSTAAAAPILSQQTSAAPSDTLLAAVAAPQSSNPPQQEESSTVTISATSDSVPVAQATAASGDASCAPSIVGASEQKQIDSAGGSSDVSAAN